MTNTVKIAPSILSADFMNLEKELRKLDEQINKKVVKVVDIEKKQKATYECPSCHKITVKRLAKGIWKCYKCSHTFAAKAFSVGE